MCKAKWPTRFKVQNKPVDPPKKPEKAPFFLPSVPSLSGEMLFEPPATASKEIDDNTTDDTSHKKKADLSSHFCQLLQSCGELKNCKYLCQAKYLNKIMDILVYCLLMRL